MIGIAVIDPGTHNILVIAACIGRDDGYKLRLAGGSTGLGKHARILGSENIAFAIQHAAHIFAQVVIGDYRNLSLIIRDAGN